MRRGFRWVSIGLALLLLGFLTRLAVLDRAAERHLDRSTAPWPPLPDPPLPDPPLPDPPGRPDPLSWVTPAQGGACPATHPVKAKLRSGIYHLEGMAAYTRTVADRCYPSPEAAEADGFRRAQR
jgi:hypothetical protein